MGSAVLVSEIIEECRVRLDLPTITSTTFFSTAKSLNLVKYSARRLSALIRRADSDYFLVSTIVPTAAGVNQVSLPSNFSDLRSISWVKSSAEYVPLEMASQDEVASTSDTSRSWESAPLYRLESETIVLYPTPNAVYDLSIRYDSGIYVTSTASSIICQPGWEEWIINDVCLRVATMMEQDPTVFAAERAETEANVVKQAASRDRFRSHQVRDLWGDDYGYDPRSLWARR